MPVTKLPRPAMGMNVEELTNLMFRYYRELEFVLGHLDSDNISEIDAHKTRVLNLEQLVAQTIIAGDIVTNTFVTNTLYANYARIAQLTVDELSTGWEKITNYLASSTADVNYLYIHDQTIQFITASTDGSATEQATDRDGNGLYWIDETHTGVTDEVNAYPVTTYVYTELVKAHFTFTEIDDVYIPQLWLGAGTGTGNNGKACVWKGTTGLYFDYYHSTTGALLRAKITDDGLDFGEIGNIIYDNEALLAGIVQWFVDTDFPAGAKEKDCLVNTDDPTIDDGLSVSTATQLTWASARHINATGTTTVTLPDPTSDKNIAGLAVDHTGVVMFCIHNANAETGMVTVTDGTLTVVLFPGESVTVRTGITAAWEVVG